MLATAGPGALHLLNGLYDARMDGVPVIAITGLAQHDAIGTHMLQDVPIDRLFAEVCLYNERVMGRAHALPTTDLAVRSALANRTPSHLCIPIDVQSQTEDTPSPKNVAGHLSVCHAPSVVLPPAEQLRAAAEVLGSCERIAICAGAGARGSGDLVEAIAHALDAPIVKAGLGKDAVPDDSRYTTGGFGLIGTPASREVLAACDGFLIIGSASSYAEFWPEPGQARAVQIDLNADRVGLRYPVEVGLVGHAGPTMEALLPLLGSRTEHPFLEQARRFVEADRALLREQAACSARPMRPQVVTQHLSDALPDRAIVTGDAGANTFVSSRLQLRRGMAFSFSGTLATMGSAVPYAIGAQIAFPDRPVVAVVGDGAMAMGLGELATLAQHDLPITVVVLRNHSLGLKIWEQNALQGNPQFGCALSPIHFAEAARACGIAGFSVEDPADVPGALAAAVAHDGPSLVEIVVDALEAPFGETLTAAQAANIVTAFDRGSPTPPRWLATCSNRGAAPCRPGSRRWRPTWNGTPEGCVARVAFRQRDPWHPDTTTGRPLPRRVSRAGRAARSRRPRSGPGGSRTAAGRSSRHRSRSSWPGPAAG